jgi:hypothetical protein
MLSFREYLEEEKNLHMVHAEDSIVDGGVEGTRRVINYFRDIRDMLSGNAKSPVNLSVKWDGSPSIFAGIVPKNESDGGKFFVAKKGVFNKNPKYYTTVQQIKDDSSLSGDLAQKFIVALVELPKTGIRGVVQGDFLFSKEDLKTVTIGDEPHVTFHPNTIVYAVPKNSELARQILSAKIGVVWHTRYNGDSFEDMSASFGEEIASGLKANKNVWAVDAVFKDVSGTATFTKAETAQITRILSDVGKIFSKLPARVLNGLAENENRRIRVNTFINKKIRAGQRIQNPSTFVAELIDYIEQYYEGEAAKKKTEKGKKSTYDTRDEVLAYFKQNSRSDIVSLFTLYNLIVDAKMMIVRKLNRVEGLRTLLLTKDGYRVTDQEGFVAIDRFGKNALKLVDRLEFSQANFSPEYIRGWQK